MGVRGVSLLLLLAATGPAKAQDKIAVPSGQDVDLFEVLHDTAGPAGLTYRFRFVAPQIARESGTIDAETAFEDMQALCDDYALEKVPVIGPVPQQIVISLMDREVPFGAPAPEATQFFEAFSLSDAGCIWEPY